MNWEYEHISDTDISTPEAARAFLIVTRPIGRHVPAEIKKMREKAMLVISAQGSDCTDGRGLTSSVSDC